MLSTELEQSTPSELLLLQKYVKLGQKHLEKHLTEEELSSLSSLGKIEKHTEEEMSADRPEFVGNTSMILNSVFTAILGMWLGISGFLGFHLDSPWLFFSLLAFCGLLGAFLGFQSNKLIKYKAQNSIDQRKTKNIELNLLKIINRNRENEIREKIHSLDQLLKEMKIQGADLSELSMQEFNDYEICLNWLSQTDRAVKDLYQNKVVSQAFLAEVEEVKTFLNNHLTNDQKRKKEGALGMIQKLSSSPIQPSMPTQSWIQANFQTLIVSLTPVLLGGFSSLFVYLGGATRIADDMGQRNLFHFLNQPHVKYTELVIALSITAYFGFTFLYMNRKAFRREQELAKIQTLLTREETKLELLDDKFLKIKQIEQIMKPICKLHQFLKKIIKE